MDIASADRVRVEILVTLPSGMRQLGDDERAMRFGSVGYLLELGNSAIMIVNQDGVSISFDGVIMNHCIAAHYDAYFAFSPSAI